MIVKSISRKTPSFGQLIRYMTRPDANRDYDLYHHLDQQNPKAIAQTFEANASLLKARKNGNILYHEILSIDTRECGQGADIKEALQRLVVEYVHARCPNNLAFGVLHDDHEGHLHYHLMISANEKGAAKRFRLTRPDFAQIKRQIEELCQTHFQELKQELVMERAGERVKKKIQDEVEEVLKNSDPPKLTKIEQITQQIETLIQKAASQDEFETLLQGIGFQFYERGKHQ